MSGDARFEDGAERPLRLKALDGDDLQVISSLIQDGVFTGADIKYDRTRRRFAILINRFRWEDAEAAEKRGRPFERVRALLAIEDVQAVRSQGLDAADKDAILSALALEFAPGEDGTGVVTLTLAGDGAIACDVEALEVMLQDVTRPYVAPSGKSPSH